MKELGIKKFGYIPTIGDCFAGGGSIPFEAARIGLKAYASDLNPMAGLLSWASLNLLSLSEDKIKQLSEFQEKVFRAVFDEIEKWGIERNSKGHYGKYFLYCNEVVCLECKKRVPLFPNFIVSKREQVIIELVLNEINNNYDIIIKKAETPNDFKLAENSFTIKDYELNCPGCKNTIPIPLIRRDRPDETISQYRYGTPNDLRQWGENDFAPKNDDIFTERLYCIKYVALKETKRAIDFYRKPGPATDATFGKVYYSSVNNEDVEREEKVYKILSDKFEDWKRKGFLPVVKIEEGDNTNQPKYEKGWTYWHHLFNPRQLLIIGLFSEKAELLSNDKSELLFNKLGLGTIEDYSSKLAIWNYGFDKSGNTFYNQALNTLFNFACRGLSACYSSYLLDVKGHDFINESKVDVIDARVLKTSSEFWITDPPYADAVNYHELTEYFLAWNKKFIEIRFPEWHTETRRILAVKGTGESFNQSMIEIYQNLTNHMPNNGMQVVMFTHQSPAVWADLTLILWSAGLHVTAAWNIATETESGGLKEGNYVKGTVILVLRKRTTSATAFTDEITFEIQEEVKQQIDSMRTLEDKEDPNFSDADYLLAAYAATLKILTSYEKIGDINVEYELSKPRDGKNIGPVEAIINNAIRTAYDYLIPQAFDSFIWKNLSAEERFFIKGMELEKSNVYQLGAYQEMARGFGVKEFKEMLFSTKANQVRFKTPTEFGNRGLGNADAFGNTLLRQVLMSISQSEKEQNGQAGRAWLKNEVEDYWNKRQTIIELLKYFSTTEHIDHMQHWESPSTYAKYLVELISNDGV